MLWVICRYFFGLLWWWFIPIRKRLAVTNFKQCFPQNKSHDLRIGMGDIVTQYVFLFFGKRARIQMPKDVLEGGICLAGHGSTWDIALISMAEQVPVTIFLRKPSGFLSATMIAYLRRSSDVQALYDRNCMTKAYQALKDGRLVIFVQDHRFNDGITTTFFSRTCLTSAAFASMAYNTKAPLYGAWQNNNGANITVTVERLHWTIPEDKNQAITVLTQQSQEFYQQKISQKPHAWLWLHDRWKILP